MSTSSSDDGVVLGAYAALDWHFSVASHDDRFIANSEHALAPLSTAVTGTLNRYEHQKAVKSAGRLLIDGEVLHESWEDRELFARLLWHVNVKAADATVGHVLLHASAAVINDKAVVLCAPMEAGKTTLVAGLVIRGANYLTDEIVAIAPDTARVRAYPKALSVDPGSWFVLPELSGLAMSPSKTLTLEQWQIPVNRLRQHALEQDPPIGAVILPRFSPSAQTVLTPLSPGNALVDVLQQVFRLERDRHRDMEALARLLTSIPSYRLTYSNLEEGCQSVEGILNSP